MDSNIMNSEFQLRKISVWKNNIRTMYRYFRLNLIASIEFKMGFATIITNILITLAVWIVYWTTILNVSNGIFGNWGKKELVVWYFFTEFSLGIFGIPSGLSVVYKYINQYGLEPILTKPTHSLIQLVGETMYFQALLRSLFAIIILISGIIIFKIQLNIFMLILGILVSVFGIVIYTCLYIVVQTFAFWIGNVEFLVDTLVDLELNFIRLPQQIFPQSILFTVFIVIPVGLFSTIPTLMVFNGGLFSMLSFFEIVLFTIFIGLLVLGIFYTTLRFYSYGLKRYEGVGE